MNSPLLAVLVVIMIVIGSALTMMNRACKTGYHAWCAPMSALARHHAKNRPPAWSETKRVLGRKLRAANVCDRQIIAGRETGLASVPSRLTFRRTSSISEKPAVSLNATSLSVANSGRPVTNEPEDAVIAAAIVAARTNLLLAKRMDDDPVPWDQFDTNYFQPR